jgi:hypothetical protein
MDDNEREQAFMSAMVTEHFVQQSIAGTTVGESSSRASIYLGALSTTLVALGFTSTNSSAFIPLAAAALPTVFILGCLTVVRLVDTSIENTIAVNRIERIRRYYATLTPSAPGFFEDEPAPHLPRGAIRTPVDAVHHSHHDRSGQQHRGRCRHRASHVRMGRAPSGGAGIGRLRHPPRTAPGLSKETFPDLRLSPANPHRRGCAAAV